MTTLNPGDKPNDAQTRKSYLSLYSVEKTKEKLTGHFRGSKIKPTKY